MMKLMSEERLDLLEKELDDLKKEYEILYTQYMLSRDRGLMYQQMLSNYIVDSYYNSCYSDYDIDEELSLAKSAMANKDFKHLHDKYSMLGEFFKRSYGIEILQFKHKSWELNFDIALIFGIKEMYENSRLILAAMENGKRVFFSEAGFLCSIAPLFKSDVPFKYRRIHSIVLDRRCMYFDSRHVSDVEIMLNSDLKLDDEQKSRAKRLISTLVENKITKFNHQPIKRISVGKRERKVLVVDQVYGDASISFGMATDDTFKKMLNEAIKDNPNADIIIKTHPYTNNTLKHRHFSVDDTNKDNIYVVDYDLNPYVLFEIVDSVYVCTSQLGLEALMAGKEVHVYGMPFYAGWGITIDALQCKRRTRKRTLEEIFYIFYVLYTKYVSYKYNAPCEIEQVIRELIELREEYQLGFIKE